MATTSAPAGSELFKNYGDNYFLSRASLEFVPVWEDYPQAEAFVGLFNTMWDTNLTHLSVKLMEDLWTMVYGWPLRSRFFNALPKDMQEFEDASLNGIRSILQPHFTRNMTYLEEHGRCADAITSDWSTLRQAGRGAFTTRSVQKNKTITGSPLLWYPNDEYFRMYGGNWFHQNDPPALENQTHSQIIMNYCWKHPESSVVLIPFGPGVQYM